MVASGGHFVALNLGGNYGCVQLVVLMVGLLMVGARRLKLLAGQGYFYAIRIA